MCKIGHNFSNIWRRSVQTCIIDRYLSLYNNILTSKRVTFAYCSAFSLYVSRWAPGEHLSRISHRAMPFCVFLLISLFEQKFLLTMRNWKKSYRVYAFCFNAEMGNICCGMRNWSNFLAGWRDLPDFLRDGGIGYPLQGPCLYIRL
jgi:hypothetical protein